MRINNTPENHTENPSEHKYHIAFGKKPTGIKLNFKDLTFPEFAQLCSKPEQGEKHEDWVLRGGDVTHTEIHISSSGREYGPGYYRGNKYLSSADFLFIDGDSSIDDPESAPDPKLVHTALKILGLNHFIYTSYSHTENKNKFRAVIPCSMVKSQIKPTAQKIIDDLNKLEVPVKYVSEMGTWAQLWHLPTRDNPDDGLFEFYEYHDGKDYQSVDSFKQPQSPAEKSGVAITGGTWEEHYRSGPHH